jgi:hypothetical protein
MLNRFIFGLSGLRHWKIALHLDVSMIETQATHAIFGIVPAECARLKPAVFVVAEGVAVVKAAADLSVLSHFYFLSFSRCFLILLYKISN